MQAFIHHKNIINDGYPIKRIETVDIVGIPQPLDQIINHVRTPSRLESLNSTQHLNILKDMTTLAYQANEYIKSPQSHNKPDLIVSNNIQLADCEQQIDIDDNIRIEIINNKISCRAKTEIIKENSETHNILISDNSNEKKDSLLNKITKSCSNTEFLSQELESKPVLPPQHTSKEIETPPNSDVKEKVETNKVTDITSNEKSAQKEKAKFIASKPPNILVYCESTVTRDNVMQTLKNVIDPDQYTIYSLSKIDISKKIWIENATLLVVAGNVTDNVGKCLLDFFLHGGKILCLCTDLLHIIIPTYRTAEVRENELVQFTYGKWKNIKMMHHIFCYQPSPVKKHFSHDNEEVFTTPSQP